MAAKTDSGAKPRYALEMPPGDLQFRGSYAACMRIALKFPDRSWVIRNETTDYAQTENQGA